MPTKYEKIEKQINFFVGKKYKIKYTQLSRGSKSRSSMEREQAHTHTHADTDTHQGDGNIVENIPEIRCIENIENLNN